MGERAFRGRTGKSKGGGPLWRVVMERRGALAEMGLAPGAPGGSSWRAETRRSIVVMTRMTRRTS